MTGKRILIVDDEPDVTELVAYKLKREGYVVDIVNDPLEIMGKARDFDPDLIILDIMMPELDGFTVCRMIRADKQLSGVPIIFLTARGEVEDRIKGLEIGAEDYICKPFDTKELTLRAKLVLKRARDIQAESDAILEVGDIQVDMERHEVTISGKIVEMTATEFKLLKLLMQKEGKVQSRENLLVNVWNYDTDTETRTIDTHIRRLRDKLGDRADMIETVRGVGYRIMPQGGRKV
jgi:two-component system phosphate regulon response regulator PhoB